MSEALLRLFIESALREQSHDVEDLARQLRRSKDPPAAAVLWDALLEDNPNVEESFERLVYLTFEAVKLPVTYGPYGMRVDASDDEDFREAQSRFYLDTSYDRRPSFKGSPIMKMIDEALISILGGKNSESSYYRPRQVYRLPQGSVVIDANGSSLEIETGAFVYRPGVS